MKKIKVLTIILIIILVTMVSFLGVYVQVQNRMENQVNDYEWAMDLKGHREIQLSVNDESKTVIKDKDGKEVDDADDLTDEQLKEKGYTKEEVKYNPDDVRNKENYEAAKELIEKRLASLDVKEYNIRLDQETGAIMLELEESDVTDEIASNITTVAKFEIKDSESGELLMDNNDVATVEVRYGSASNNNSIKSSGTNVFLNIVYTDEGAKKFEQITTDYKTPEDSNDEKTTENTTTENTTTEDTTTENSTSEEEKEKKITIYFDDEQLLSTNFESPVRTGNLQLTYGSATTDQETLQDYAQKAHVFSTALKSGKMPVKYDVNLNKYVKSDITKEDIKTVLIIAAVVIGIALLVLIIRYKLNGILGLLSYIGYISSFLLLIRYTDVVISIEGLFAIGIIAILNYVFIDKILNMIKKNKEEKISTLIKETYKNYYIRLIPIIIMSIAFCFVTWRSINSFGMIMFWGILLTAIYNFIISTPLLILCNTKKDSKEK